MRGGGGRIRCPSLNANGRLCHYQDALAYWFGENIPRDNEDLQLGIKSGAQRVCFPVFRSRIFLWV